MERETLKEIRNRFTEQFGEDDDKGRMQPGLIEGGDGVPVHLSGISDSAHSVQDIMESMFPGYVSGEDALFVHYAIADADNYGAVEADQVLLAFPLVFENVKVHYANSGVIQARS